MSGAPDPEKMTDQELMAYLNGGGAVQPVDAETHQPLNPEQARGVAQYAAAGGFDPAAQPGTARKPLAQLGPNDAPPPGAYYFDPQGRVQQAHGGPVEQIGQFLNDRGRALARGFPVFGAFADEANSATAAALAPTLEPMLRHAPGPVQVMAGYDPRKEIGDIPTFGGRMAAAQSLQRLTDEGFDQAHPKESAALQIAGGVTPALMLGLTAPGVIAPASNAAREAGILTRMGAGAVDGGVVGGAHGYGMGYGGAGDSSRLAGARGGAMIGGIAGGVLPAAVQAGGVAARNTVGRLVDAIRGNRTVQAPVAAEAERLAQTIHGAQPSASPIKPDRGDLESALVTAQRPEITVPASNVDDAYVRIARAISRQKMTPEEAAARTQEIGSFGALADTGDATQDLLRASINRPGRGATIARENLGPRQNGTFDPDTGEWTVRPSAMRVTDQAQAGLGVGGKEYHGELESILQARKAAAGPAYAKAYQAAPVSTRDLAEFSGAPDFGDAYARARAISQKEFVKLPDGSEKIIPLPEKMPDQLDWRTLDLMKQGLDDTISEAKREGIGANAQGASKGYLSRFVAKLDSLNPDYKAARDAFAGPTAMKDALEEGRGLLTEDAPVVASDMAGRSEAERQMIRLGALQSLQSKLGNANVTFDAANQAGFLKPNQLARFKALFPDAKSFADFYRSMANEKAMFGTNQAAFGNSTTAKQLLHVMEPSDPQLEGATAVVPAAASGNVVALVRAIHRMGMESPMREGVAETIASVLSSHNHEQLPSVVKALVDAQRRAEVSDAVRGTMGSMSGAAAGHAAQPRQ